MAARQCLTFSITENKNLRVELTPEGREELMDMMEEPRNYSPIEMWHELIEHDMCNGGYQMIRPEFVGALTDSPLIVHSDDVVYPDQGNEYLRSKDSVVYWYPNYMVEDELQLLLDNGFIIFTNGQN